MFNTFCNTWGDNMLHGKLQVDNDDFSQTHIFYANQIYENTTNLQKYS